MTTLFVLGRVIFGGYFLYSGIMHFKNEKHLTGYAKMKGVPQAKYAVLLSGILMVLSGAGILLNAYFKNSALLVIIFLIPTTFMMHAFWKGDASQKATEQMAFLKNMALIGAALMLYGM